MSTDVSSVTKHFPSAENGFTTTTSGSVSSGATTVGLNSVAGYTNGETAVFVIDPTDASKKQTFTGVIDTSGVQVTGVIWTAGTNVAHASGATVVDYATATHISMITKGLLVEHDQDGTHGAVTATSVTATTGTFTNLTVSGTATSQGWTALGDVPDTVTANGNRNFDLVFNGVDHTSTLSPGMKLQLARTVAAPDQCTDLEASSSQYFSLASAGITGMTFTDDFTVSCWIKPESYATNATIASRYNGTSGWILQLSATGQIILSGHNAGAANTSQVLSYQLIPLGKWTHIVAQLDMSAYTATTTTSYIMINGIDTPAYVARGGTNPTALVQAGNLAIGGRGGGSDYFDGKIAQVAIYSAKVTQANALATMSQSLTGSETNLICGYTLDNSLLDLTANNNDLTANGGAVATNADSPFANAVTAGTQEYAEINSVVFSTNTTVNVRVADTCQIPTTGGVSAVNYSTQSNPFGLPRISNVLAFIMVPGFTVASTSRTAIPGLTTTVKVPPGRGIKLSMYCRYINGTSGDLGSFEIHDTAVSSSTNIIQGADVAVDASGGPSIHLETIEYPSTSTTTTTSKTYIGACVNNTAARNLTYNGEITSTYRRPLFLKVELV